MEMQISRRRSSITILFEAKRLWRAQPLKASHRKGESPQYRDHKPFRDLPGPTQHPRLAGYQYAAGSSSQHESLSALREAASFRNSRFSLQTVSRSSRMQRTLKNSYLLIYTTIMASCFYTNSPVHNPSPNSCFAVVLFEYLLMWTD